SAITRTGGGPPSRSYPRNARFTAAVLRLLDTCAGAVSRCWRQATPAKNTLSFSTFLYPITLFSTLSCSAASYAVESNRYAPGLPAALSSLQVNRSQFLDSVLRASMKLRAGLEPAPLPWQGNVLPTRPTKHRMGAKRFELLMPAF